MSLEPYLKKRKFESTPEPNQQKAKHEAFLRFVVQKHAARRLHYDFRLENRGVLVSWAVPKGPSLNPDDMRLAMMTEDHPYDYQYFEGVIPKGNYGAGNVIIWDRGTYELIDGGDKENQEDTFSKGLKEGKLSIIMHGEKLKGEFHLFKTKGGSKENQWFIKKKDDDFASKIDVTEHQKSVISGKTVDEIGQQKKFDWKDWQEEIKYYNLQKKDLKTPVSPMLATLVDEPFDNKDWFFEVKWDGYRAITEIKKDEVKLYSRNHNSYVQKYQPLVSSLKMIKTELIADGEIVVIDEHGKPDFNALQNYEMVKKPLVYYLFDILWLDGYDLTTSPLELRKKLLKEAINFNDTIRFSDHITEKGIDFFNIASSQNLEGVMAKDSKSSYSIGKRSKKWLKFKTKKRQEAIIGGFTEPRGGRKGIGALILGVNEEGEFKYIGHSGSGMTDEQLKDLRNQLDRLIRPDAPFNKPPKPNGPVHWVEPKVICEVEFNDWTPEGSMRHPVLVGIRSDKKPREITIEKPLEQNQQLPFDFTHLDKIYWPEKNITKGDLVDYYRQVADYILPYISKRPMSLLRQPNGIHGQAFFQKDMTSDLPNGFKTFKRYSESNNKDINFFICTDLDSLLYIVQLGSIEINPWNSTVDKPENPDWLVLDLDPEAIGFDEVIKVARTTKKLLDELGLRAFLKTSGKTGMHIYLPTLAKYTYDQVRQFAQLLANKVVEREASITSVERQPSKRQGKIYVDYLQNRLGQTLAASYSVRPTLDASVSMPLGWDELESGLKPENFTLLNVASLLKQRKDPWGSFFDRAISIENSIAKIEGH